MPEAGTETTVVNENTNSVNNSDNGADTQATSDNQDKSVPLHTFLEMKKSAKQLEEKLKLMEADIKAQKENKLLEDGKLQELLDAKTTELTNTQSELEKTKAEAEESKVFKAAQVVKYKKRMGSKWLDEYAMLSLTALDTLVNNAVPKKPVTDGGADAEHAGVELTADQKREAIAKYPHISVEKAYEYHIDNLKKSGKIKEK